MKSRCEGKAERGKTQVTWLGLLNRYKTGMEGKYVLWRKQEGNETLEKGSKYTTNPRKLIDRTVTVTA